MVKGFAQLALVAFGGLLLIAAGIFVFVKQTGKSPRLSESPKLESTFVRESVIFSDPSINNPEVITLPDGSFRMFAHRTNQMLSAKSPDGKKFTLESGVRLQGGMPALVTLSPGRYRMYFNSFPDSSIKSAVSTDGLNFAVEAGVRLSKGIAGSLDQGGIIHPSVLKLQDGTYKMYYDGVSTSSSESGPDSWRIMSASSKDGLIWTKDTGTRIATGCEDDDETIEDDGEDDDALDVIAEDDCLNGAWNVNARLEDGEIILYFSADVDSVESSGIWRASSRDGLNFTVDGLVLGQDEAFKGKRVESGLGPKGVPQDPFILETNAGLRLFYWTPEGGILSAIAK